MNSENAYYKKMTEHSLVKLIVSLGIPTTISMLVTSIYNMADTYFVGTLGESQQAATGVLFTLQAIIQAIAFMVGHGSGTMISKSLADKDKTEASKYISTGMYFGISLGLIVTILGLAFLTPFVRLLGSTDTILPYAKQYGVCVLLSCPVFVGSIILNNALRYEGKAFYSMIGLVSGSIINILGDYLLVWVLDFGVLGAGIATAVSQTISFGLLLYFYIKTAQSKISYKFISKNSAMYATIFKIGFPSLIRQSLSFISGGLLNNLSRPYGDAAIAAMSIVNRFSSFIICVGLGIGQGLQPVASFNYQAKKYNRTKKSLVITMVIGFCLILSLAAPVFFLAPQIVYMFQPTKAVMDIGVSALRYSCIGVVFLSLSVPVNMLFQSIRLAGLSSALSLMRSGLMFIPTLIITTNLLGVTGLQISQPLADIFTGLISVPFMIWFMRKNHDKN